MTNQTIKTVQSAIQHWYIPLIVGLLFMGMGIYTFITPLESYVTLALLFSLSFLFSGIGEIVFAISNRGAIDHWVWTLVFGIITTVMGFLLFNNPEMSMLTLSFYIGFVVLSRSAGAMGFALDLKKNKVSGWGSLFAMGILGALFSFILLSNPVFAGMTTAIWTGIALFSVGLFSVFFSMVLKKLKP